MQRALVDAIQKITGKSIGVDFSSDQPHQGQYEAAKKMVTLAATSALSASNAFHEAFHAVAEHFLTPEQITTLYKAFRQGAVRMQLKELLKDSPAAWEAVKNDPRELAAYAFQFWHAGALKLGHEPTSTVGKIMHYLVDKWDKVNAWLRNQPTAERMLELIKDGAFADGKASPAEIALAAHGPALVRVREVTAKAFKVVDKLYDDYLYPYDTRVRDFGNPAADWIAKQMYAQVGEKSGQRGLVQEIPAQMKARINSLDQIMRDPSGTFKKTLDEMAAGEIPTDAAMEKQIRGWLDEQHQYMKDAGIDIGYEKNYIPMSWDGEKIGANRDAFVKMLQGHQADIDALNDELRNKSGKSDFEEMTPESIADMMAQRGTATGELLGSTLDAHGTPNADFTLNRVFGFLDNADRRPFVRDDIAAGLMRYAKQAVRRAEWTRRFGEQGQHWDAKVEQARKYGLSKEQEQLLTDYREDAFGGKLQKMNPTLRKIYAANTVYQNYRVLGLSVLSNMIDPFGVAVRSGEWGEAWNAYKTAAGRIFKSGRMKTADLEELSEMIGAMERAGTSDALSELYGGVNIEGQLHKVNDALFNYNGMNGLTRSVRVAALAAGMRFVTKHAQDGGEERHLQELGLRKEDVQLKDDGSLKVLERDGLDRATSERVQRALNRFVDESAMRPNVGERTRWGANPYLAPLFHLKQYVFSFNKVINKKLEHELLEHGNMTPYMMAASYIPIMAGTAMLRDMILHGGAIPEKNGFLHYAAQGFTRSGLMGPSDLGELAVGGTLTGNMNSVRQALGPTADQVMDAFGAIASSSHTHSFGDFLKESAPLGSVIQHY